MLAQDEQRIFQRHTMKINLEIHKDIVGETIDISLAGAKCCVEDFVPEAKRIKATFYFNNEYFDIRGVVLRSDGVAIEDDSPCGEAYTIAINFDEMTEAKRESLINYIKVFEEDGKN